MSARQGGLACASVVVLLAVVACHGSVEHPAHPPTRTAACALRCRVLDDKGVESRVGPFDEALLEQRAQPMLDALKACHGALASGGPTLVTEFDETGAARASRWAPAPNDDAPLKACEDNAPGTKTGLTGPRGGRVECQTVCP